MQSLVLSASRKRTGCLTTAIKAAGATLFVMNLGSGPGITGALAQSAIQVGCQKVALMDAESHALLFERGADDLLSPASTAKIMTAELIFSEIKSGKLSLSDTFVVSEYAWRTGGSPARGSSMFAAVNSRIRVEDLLRGLIIQSGNDAAIVLAEGVAGTEEVFAGLMTKRARELGLTRSTFTNAWGRSDPGQKVTVREMALLADHIISTYPDLYKIFSEKDFTWNKITQVNRNPLLMMNIGADGLKTGNIDESGYALVGSAVENGQRLIIALNGCKSASERAEDARRLLMWGFRAFDARTLFKPDETVGTVKLYGAAQGDAKVAAHQTVRVFAPRGTSEKLSGKIVYEGPVPAPVQKGALLAQLKLYRGTALVLDIPLYATEDIAAGPLYRRAWDAGSEFLASLWRKYVVRQ